MIGYRPVQREAGGNEACEFVDAMDERDGLFVWLCRFPEPAVGKENVGEQMDLLAETPLLPKELLHRREEEWRREGLESEKGKKRGDGQAETLMKDNAGLISARHGPSSFNNWQCRRQQRGVV